MARKKENKDKVLWRLVEGNYSVGGIRFTPRAGIWFPIGFNPNEHYAGSKWELDEEEATEELIIEDEGEE